MHKILVITGQTATGKTELAYTYAKQMNGDLINADARQLYNHLDIISGKDLNPKYPTHLYDIADPKEYFSSYDWVKLAENQIYDLLKIGKTPIIVGGSYLYLKHLLYGIQTEGIQPNWRLRKELDLKPVEELQAMLKKISKKTFEEMNQSDRNNPRRLMRKIEIVLSRPATPVDGHPELVSGSLDGFRNKFGMAIIEFIGIRFKEKELLTSKITKRVEDRIKMGAFEEVKRLLEMGYTQDDPGLKTIGYQQLIKYFRGKISKEQAINEWIAKEVQYTKRQYTFMKTDKNIIWRLI